MKAGIFKNMTKERRVKFVKQKWCDKVRFIIYYCIFTI
jgi:hypothetical protein